MCIRDSYVEGRQEGYPAVSDLALAIVFFILGLFCFFGYRVILSILPVALDVYKRQVEELGDVSSEKGNVLRGSVVAMLQKKLLVNSAGILLDLLGKAGDKGLINDVSSYLSAALYKMYRYVYLRCV